MKNNVILLSIIFLIGACKNPQKAVSENPLEQNSQEITTDAYELSLPIGSITSVLLLFGGYPEHPADIQREFNIADVASKNGIALVYMNYNQRLWLKDSEKLALATQLQQLFLKHKLPKDNIYLGGFSSGGNMALLLSDFMHSRHIAIAPKGVFAVDAPIDLQALYKSSKKNIERNFSKVAVQESTWLLESLEKHLGNPDKDFAKYEQYAVFTSRTGHIDNLKGLKNTKIRLYTEPDTLWWKTHRNADEDQTNAYYLKQLSKELEASNFTDVSYIETINKGYRANGDRHPHSWQIVDHEDLLRWMAL